jgi:thiol-disulfide isomerase/thioredoxin
MSASVSICRCSLALGTVLSLGLGLALPAAATPAQTDSDAIDPFTTASNSLVGKQLSDWGDLHFLDQPTHRTPADFRGHVVIVRFWTAGCPRCRASAATLSDWTRRYESQGLEVIAILLPKKGEAIPSDKSVRALADDMGWKATLAVDQDWSALERVWDHSGPRYAVSVGLLVDRDGIVRAVHHGGYLSEDDPRGLAETKSFRTALEQVLAERDSVTSAPHASRRI